MSKDLKYYMNLPYDVHIEAEIEDDHNVYYAYIFELGKHACYGKGDTPEEALKSLDEIKEDIISYHLEHNKPIPEPAPKMKDDLPSGKFIVRTNPIIHKQLLDQSKVMGLSFNLLVNHLLVHNLQSAELKNYLDEKFTRLEKCIEQQEEKEHFVAISFSNEPMIIKKLKSLSKGFSYVTKSNFELIINPGSESKESEDFSQEEMSNVG